MDCSLKWKKQSFLHVFCNCGCRSCKLEKRVQVCWMSSVYTLRVLNFDAFGDHFQTCVTQSGFFNFRRVSRQDSQNHPCCRKRTCWYRDQGLCHTISRKPGPPVCHADPRPHAYPWPFRELTLPPVVNFRTCVMTLWILMTSSSQWLKQRFVIIGYFVLTVQAPSTSCPLQ